MIEAYRISKEPSASRAFSGESSKEWGGRWNSKGVAVVYAAATRSLAMLEILVHLRGSGAGSTVKRPYLIYPVSFDEAQLEELSNSNLPPGWDSEPPVHASQSIGDAWVLAAGSAVLSIPSAIVPEERNYVLNPNHKGFSQIRIGSAAGCRFDPRLL